MYFSGTGNTYLAVKRYIEVLKGLDISVDLIALEKYENGIDVSEYDRVGIAYPIHAFNAPRIVLNKLKLINASEEPKKAFTIMVSGEPLNFNHTSSDRVRKILKKRNIFIESEYHYVMPYNMIFRHTENMAYKMYQTMNKLVEVHVHNYFIDCIRNRLKKPVIGHFLTVLLRIEQAFAPINGKHFKVDMSKCIKCMKCIDTCPTDNIKFEDDKFVFLNKCILCTRCSFNCPKDAFKIALLNNWRVNKKYKFIEPKEVEINKHSCFCKKSYDKYFRESEKLIESFNN